MQIIKRNKSQLAYYTSEVDEGLYDAWNKGIKVVASQWVMFLGAGDTLKSDALVSYKCFFEKFGYDFDYVSAKVMRTRQDGSNLSTYGDKWEWSSSRFFMNVAHPGSLHSVSYFKRIGLLNKAYSICADYELLLREGRTLRAGFMNKVVANMPIGGCSFSTKAIYQTYNIKIQTKARHKIFCALDAIKMLFLLHTYNLRHKLH